VTGRPPPIYRNPLSQMALVSPDRAHKPRVVVVNVNVRSRRWRLRSRSWTMGGLGRCPRGQNRQIWHCIIWTMPPALHWHHELGAGSAECLRGLKRE
jgi:hypothetical protein